MATLTKKRKTALAKFDTTKVYTLDEATQIVKQVSTTKFDATVDIAVRLGVDPRKSTEMVRGTVSLPHGTGRTVNVLVLADPFDGATEAWARFNVMLAAGMLVEAASMTTQIKGEILPSNRPGTTAMAYV